MYLYIQCFWGKLNHAKKIRNYLKKSPLIKALIGASTKHFSAACYN